MYWRRFEALYSAFIKRSIVEDMKTRKNAMIAGMWGNTNLDDKKGTRMNAIRELDDQMKEAVLQLYDPQPEQKLEDNPFFAAMKIPELHDMLDDEQRENMRLIAENQARVEENAEMMSGVPG